MKYKTLVGKSEKLADKFSQGQSIKPGKLGKLQQALIDKAAGYETRLETLTDPEKCIELVETGELAQLNE